MATPDNKTRSLIQDGFLSHLLEDSASATEDNGSEHVDALSFWAGVTSTSIADANLNLDVPSTMDTNEWDKSARDGVGPVDQASDPVLTSLSENDIARAIHLGLAALAAYRATGAISLAPNSLPAVDSSVSVVFVPPLAPDFLPNHNSLTFPVEAEVSSPSDSSVDTTDGADSDTSCEIAAFPSQLLPTAKRRPEEDLESSLGPAKKRKTQVERERRWRRVSKEKVPVKARVVTKRKGKEVESVKAVAKKGPVSFKKVTENEHDPMLKVKTATRGDGLRSQKAVEESERKADSKKMVGVKTLNTKMMLEKKEMTAGVGKIRRNKASTKAAKGQKRKSNTIMHTLATTGPSQPVTTSAALKSSVMSSNSRPRRERKASAKIKAIADGLATF